MERTMRFPTFKEWDWLAEIANGNDEIMHWCKMFSWCDDAGIHDPVRRAFNGFYSAYYRNSYSASSRCVDLGFRPAIDIPGALGPDGSRVVMGTLYMGGEPVRVPQKPTWAGDIMDYVPGIELELRGAMDDPAYQLMGIKVGPVLIADRVMLKRISWVDVQDAIGGHKEDM